MKHVVKKKNNKTTTHSKTQLIYIPTCKGGAMYLSNHDVVVLDKINKLLYSVTKTLFLLLFLPESLSKNILNALYEVISSENLFLLLHRLLLSMAHFTLVM